MSTFNTFLCIFNKDMFSTKNFKSTNLLIMSFHLQILQLYFCIYTKNAIISKKIMV